MPKRLPRARTLKGDPKLVHYDSGGGMPGEAPIVLLHGATLRSEDWENIFPRLATRYRVVAYDARGHGKSARAASYRLDDLVADAVRVLREIVKAPAILIGHSLGGATALATAAREPALVRSAVLEDPWVARYHDGIWRKDLFAALHAIMPKQAEPDFARAVGDLPLPFPGPRGERRVREVRGFYSAERLATYYGTVDPAFVRELTRPEPEGAAALAAAVGAVEAPLLLLAADAKVDSALADGEVERFEAAGAQVVRFPGHGHRIHGQKPEAFLEAIEPFLRKTRAESAAERTRSRGSGG
ncbi:MAG TPA: alpha/beta hydrolase [Candidatus Limnocylindria bacterium]|nr:alpha/beta hydrolase [Candidatus Limnocylindria bacterium]